MGKPKKGTKAHDEDLDDDVTSGQMGRKVVEKPGDNTNMGKKDKKKNKGKADDDDGFDDDDVSITGKSDQKASDNTSKKDKKKKKGKTKDDDDDIEDDGKGDHKAAEKTNENTAAGKKDKKKKKSKARDDDDDSEDDTMTGKPDHKLSDGTAGSKKDKKKKKGKARDDEDDDDEEDGDRDIKRNFKALSLQDEMDVDDVPVSAAKKNKDKKKTKGLSAFQLLGEMDDDDMGGDSDADQTDDDKSTKEDIVLEKVASESSKPKKKENTKKKEKQKKPEEEDIDAIMASLEEAGTEKKKKGKKSKKTEEDKAAEEEVAVSEAKEVEKVELKVVTIDDLDAEDGEYEKKKKKKKGKKGAQAVEEAAKEEAVGEKKEGEDEEGDDDGSTVKSAAQKKKEKREREKQKKQQEKHKQKKPGTEEGAAGSQKDEVAVEEHTAQGGLEAEKLDGVAVKDGTPDGQTPDGDDVGDESKDGKKKKKKKGEKVEKEEKAKPGGKKLAMLKEHLKKIQEEEQKAREEQERERLLEEERIRKYEEMKRLEEEKKMKKKLKKKEREERLKKEGKFLTEKQKQDKRRLEQMLEAMKEAGAELPSKEDVRKKKPIYTKKKKASGQGMGDAAEKSPSPTTPTSPMETDTPLLEVKSATAVEERKDSLVEVEVADEKQEAVEVIEEVKDVWDAESGEDEEEEDEEDEDEDEEEEEVKPKAKPVQTLAKTAAPAKTAQAKPTEEDTSDEEDDEDEEDEDEDESSEESESDDELTPAERGKEKVLKHAEAANKERNIDNLRAPVVCVLGHVDTGKTKILDKLRKTNVQDGEAGGITQQIGATNVPKDAILDKTKMCKEFTKQELKLPGLLIIDTPGHESFSNLRVRGTSLCDIAILVIDIMHGLEPQTIESINLLKERKTPFVVALNKVDRLYQWKPQPMADVQNTVKKQSPHTKAEFDERAQQVILQLATEGLNAALFYENKNPREYVSMVPTSAHTGDGMGNLVALICELCQSMLAKKLMYSPSLQAVVMEVKAITGMGTTIDVILINGALNEGDTIVLAGTEGPIVTQIRGLLMPQPMKELRVKNQYEHHKTVKAAQGVKVIAKDMEKALAGLPLYVAHDADEKEYYKEEVAAVLKDTLESIKVQDRGVFVQASTLGSLEALLEFLKSSEIPYAGISIGPVHKKDIMRASVMLEHDSQYAVILAFDVKVERDAQEMADNLGVRIFTADIIYHLFDAFIKYRDDLKRKRQEEFKHIAVFPCKLRILPQFIFNTRDPIVMGVSVEAGFLKEGTPICVPTKEFLDLGRIASIELNHKPVEIARQGQEICIKIMPIPGEAPKMFGRHFDETDLLVSKISRQSIDAVKDHFREEMSKPDWKLMVELKKQFEIL